jgi:hypothetical protein
MQILGESMFLTGVSFTFIFSHSLEIIKDRFDDYAVKKQEFLGDDERRKKVLSLVTEENILLCPIHQNLVELDDISSNKGCDGTEKCSY